MISYVGVLPLALWWTVVPVNTMGCKTMRTVCCPTSVRHMHFAKLHLQAQWPVHRAACWLGNSHVAIIDSVGIHRGEVGFIWMHGPDASMPGGDLHSLVHRHCISSPRVTASCLCSPVPSLYCCPSAPWEAKVESVA